MPRKKSKKSQSFIEAFADMPDPRIDRRKLHQLTDIFIVALTGILSGVENWVDIEEMAKLRLDWLRKYVPLKNGVPSHDTLSRVFSLIDPGEFGKRFIEWTRTACLQSGSRLVAIDGKTVRRSFANEDGKGAIHLVNAWAIKNRLSLGQVKTAAKSNEITAIPQLLDLLDINGCIISIDAAGCQKGIAEKIVENGGDYVLALKGNQGGLLAEAKSFFDEIDGKDFDDCQKRHWRTVNKGHGRVEKRDYWLAEDHLCGGRKEEWWNLRCFGKVVSERTVKGKSTVEERYYITSLPCRVKEFAAAVRGHWGIENSLHWVLDVVFSEDDCRVRKGYGAENMSGLRKVALNMLRLNKSLPGKSLNTKRLHCAHDTKYLEKVMGF